MWRRRRWNVSACFCASLIRERNTALPKPPLQAQNADFLSQGAAFEGLAQVALPEVHLQLRRLPRARLRRRRFGAGALLSASGAAAAAWESAMRIGPKGRLGVYHRVGGASFVRVPRFVCVCFRENNGTYILFSGKDTSRCCG